MSAVLGDQSSLAGDRHVARSPATAGRPRNLPNRPLDSRTSVPGRRAKVDRGKSDLYKTDFNGRPILVTGASGGIGGATVRHLVKAGADVIAGGRSGDALDRLSAETGARIVRFDLTSEESVRGALESLDVWGVVNCGGFGGEIATPMDTDIEVFDKVMSVNARGPCL